MLKLGTQGFYHLGFDTSWLDELLKCRSVDSGEREFKFKLKANLYAYCTENLINN